MVGKTNCSKLDNRIFENRSQRVKLNSDCFLSWLTVPAGVPQSTCLGPWLFLVMVNDLRSNMENTSLWKIADDGTRSETVYRLGTSSLQNEIDAVYQWALANNFQLNSLKCKKILSPSKRHLFLMRV